MKRMLLLGLLLIGLSGCSGNGEEMEQGLALRSKLLHADSFSFDAEVTADYGDKLHRFSMECRANNTGSVDFTITSPETLAGITGTVDEESGKLTFDDIALQFDLLTDEQLSPVSAPWILVKTLRSGYLTSVCREDENLRMTIHDRYEDDALVLDIWLDTQELPIRAEILYDGKRILTLDVKNTVIG